MGTQEGRPIEAVWPLHAMKTMLFAFILGLSVLWGRPSIVEAFTLNGYASRRPTSRGSGHTTIQNAWDGVRHISSVPSSLVQVFATSSSQQSSKEDTGMTMKQEDFIKGYMNKHHSDLLLKFADIFTTLGSEMAKANAWRGGSFTMSEAKILGIIQESDDILLQLEVKVQRQGKGPVSEVVEFSIDTDPIAEKARRYDAIPPLSDDIKESLAPIDSFVRRAGRLCWIARQPEVSGKLIQLAIQMDGKGIGKLPENMYLNQVPHNRYVRQFFYDAASEAVFEAVKLCSDGKLSNRMQIISQFPEMNPSMDSYRIGTILELVRAVTIRLAEENLRVRVCVQGSMGVGIFTGVPKQLNGVAKLMQMMDWQSGEGQANEGMVGDYVNFGGIGPEHVLNEGKKVVRVETTGEDGVSELVEKEVTQNQDDVFILIAPQSMVGTDSSIIPSLSAMVDAAGDRPVILVNPDLTDKVSAAGQQSVRGRQQRIDFANSFETVFHFQNIYVSGTSYFPILGAVTKMTPTEQWIAHQRRDFANGEGEIYVPVLASESKPEGEAILEAFEK